VELMVAVSLLFIVGLPLSEGRPPTGMDRSEKFHAGKNVELFFKTAWRFSQLVKKTSSERQKKNIFPTLEEVFFKPVGLWMSSSGLPLHCVKGSFLINSKNCLHVNIKCFFHFADFFVVFEV
jgi:hypothetical protein